MGRKPKYATEEGRKEAIRASHKTYNTNRRRGRYAESKRQKEEAHIVKESFSSQSFGVTYSAVLKHITFPNGLLARFNHVLQPDTWGIQTHHFPHIILHANIPLFLGFQRHKTPARFEIWTDLRPYQLDIEESEYDSKNVPHFIKGWAYQEELEAYKGQMLSQDLTHAHTIVAALKAAITQARPTIDEIQHVEQFIL